MLRERQFSKHFRNVEIRDGCFRGLPRGIKARLSTSFDTVKIHSPSSSSIEARNEAFHRQHELRDPSLGRFIQNNAALQTTLQVMLLAWCNVQIDPKSIRTDFEFLVPAELRRVGLQKNFRDVAIPELIAASIGLGIRKNANDAEFCLKSDKKRLACPQ